MIDYAHTKYRDYKAKIKVRRSKYWPALRKWYKAKHSECEACGRKNKWVIFVHHIYPFHLFPAKELEVSNLISLCFWCHFTLGHLRVWKSYNLSVCKDAKKLLVKIKNRP